jgi:hypothetical protein
MPGGPPRNQKQAPRLVKLGQCWTCGNPPKKELVWDRGCHVQRPRRRSSPEPVDRPGSFWLVPQGNGFVTGCLVRHPIRTELGRQETDR